MPKNGFSFCGIHISSLKLEYAPELENTYVYKPADFESHIESFEAHNGGYYYGSWNTPKEFVLRCFFEETSVDRGIMNQVYNTFKKGRSGKLIFDRRPWCYYNVTVTDPVELDLTNYLNGLVTIRMKAMYPFARSDIMVNTRAEKYHDILMANSAVFDKEAMRIEAQKYTLTQNTANPILLVNPGTERAALGFYIEGNVGSGVTISNKTTGQSCKMIAITKAKTTDAHKDVYVDPISGKTVLMETYVDSKSGKIVPREDGTKELAFMYHQYGFLELEPSFPAVRNIYVTYAGGNSINVSNIISENYIDKYIFIKDEWHRITAQPDKHTLTVNGQISSSGSEKTMIIPMNEIHIKADTTMNITIQFEYKPTYA